MQTDQKCRLPCVQEYAQSITDNIDVQAAKLGHVCQYRDMSDVHVM
jgi:hypothetical protein